MLKANNFITNDGIRITYYDTLKSGQPLLAVPGIGSSVALWQEAVRLFTED